MFFEVMKPLMARVRKAKREGDNETAFAELFGAALAGTHWAADNECWMDTAFAKFFWGARACCSFVQRASLLRCLLLLQFLRKLGQSSMLMPPARHCPAAGTISPPPPPDPGLPVLLIHLRPSEFSDAWRTILALPGPQIAGLVNPWAGQQAVFGGGAGGANPQQQQQLDGLLKQRLSAWLQKWQDDLNSVFDDFDAGSGAGTYKGQTASVTIFP